MRIDYQLISYHLGLLVASTLCFLLSLRLGLLGNIVFFYRGIILLVIIAVVLAIALSYVRKKVAQFPFLGRDVVLVTLVFFFANLSFFATVPVVLERSISVHLLGTIFYESEPLTKAEVEDRFISGYVLQNDAMGKRLHEQLVSGNITTNDTGRYVITERGMRVTYTLLLLDAVLLPDERPYEIVE
mgnify:CR=1 FL=1